MTTSVAPQTATETEKNGVITGPLSTPLTRSFTNSVYNENPKPSREWTEEEIEREELRVRGAFMRASVDYKKTLGNLPTAELNVIIEREGQKQKYQELFEKYKVGQVSKSHEEHEKTKEAKRKE